MSKLNPCPCGKTPETLCIENGTTSTYKYAWVSGSCCSEWSTEFRTNYEKPYGVEYMNLAREAWNRATRPEPQVTEKPFTKEVMEQENKDRTGLGFLHNHYFAFTKRTDFDSQHYRYWLEEWHLSTAENQSEYIRKLQEGYENCPACDFGLVLKKDSAPSPQAMIAEGLERLKRLPEWKDIATEISEGWELESGIVANDVMNALLAVCKEKK